MPFKSEAQKEKIRQLEKEGKLPVGTFNKWEAETPKDQKLPDRATKTSSVILRKPRQTR